MVTASVSKLKDVKSHLEDIVSLLEHEISVRKELINNDSVSKLEQLKGEIKIFPENYFYFTFADCSIQILRCFSYYNGDFMRTVRTSKSHYSIHVYGFLPLVTFPESIHNRMEYKAKSFNYGHFQDFDDSLIYFKNTIIELLNKQLDVLNELF